MRAAPLFLLVLIICQATVSADDLPYTAIDMSELGGAIAFAWKPNEDVIAVGGKNGVYLFTGAGEEIDHFAEDVSVQALAWTPDGQTLAVATRDNMIFLWTSFSWGYSWRSYYNFDAIDMAFSPDGSQLAIVTELAVSCGSNLCATYAQLNVYDVSAVSPVFSSDTWIWMLGPSHSGPEHGLLDWPTEEMLYVGREEYDTRTWTARMPLDGISGNMQTADSTGTFVAATFLMDQIYDDPSGHGFTIQRPGSELLGFAAIRGTVTALAWRPGTREIAAGDTAGDITLWRVDEAALPTRLVTLQGHLGGIQALEWNADGSRLTGLGGGAVYVWRDFSQDISRAENAPAREFSVDGDATLAVWHPVGEWLVVPAAQRLDFYGVGDSTLAFSLDVPLEGEFWLVQFSADGRRLMIAAAQNVAVFEVEQDADGLRLSVVNRYTVVEREYDLQKFRAAFAPDGLAVALSFGYSSGLESYDDQPLTTIWHPDSGERHTLPTGYTENLAWSPDSTMLLAGDQNSATVRVFDADTGTERLRMYGLEPYCCGSFSPRSIDWKTETIAFSTWGLVETAAVTGSGDSFSAAAAQRFWSNVSTIALNPDGMLLAGIDEFTLMIESEDAYYHADNVVVWDVSSQRPLWLIPTNAEALLWSPDGGTLASLDFNGTDTTFTFWPMIP